MAENATSKCAPTVGLACQARSTFGPPAKAKQPQEKRDRPLRATFASRRSPNGRGCSQTITVEFIDIFKPSRNSRSAGVPDTTVYRARGALTLKQSNGQLLQIHVHLLCCFALVGLHGRGAWHGREPVGALGALVQPCAVSKSRATPRFLTMVDRDFFFRSQIANDLKPSSSSLLGGGVVGFVQPCDPRDEAQKKPRKPAGLFLKPNDVDLGTLQEGTCVRRRTAAGMS